MSEYATKAEAQKVFSRLKQQPANQVCFDCSNRNPTWTSIPFGVLLCLECSSVHRNLGVHISFVKSSNLDEWQRIQLRQFKFGGNTAAKDFFMKNGGSQYINKTADATAKYTSTVANKYKEKLKQKALEDAKKNPEIVTLDDLGDAVEEDSGNSDNNDFFSNWTKPINSSPSPLNSQSATPSASQEDLSKVGTKKPVTRTTRTSTLAAKRTGAAKLSILSGKGNGPRNSRLNSKRINKTDEDIDFEELERKAKLEAEEAKKLGYKPETPEPKPQAVAQPIERESSGLSLGGGQRPKEKLAPAPIKETTQQFQKLGFGMVAGNNDTSTNKKQYKEVQYTGQVSNKFGGQKAISSDEFFGRGPRFDENAKQEAREKLQNFSNAQSISSASYFGEDEEQQMQRGRSTSGGLGGLESQAREFASKFSGNANEDLDVLKDALEGGANKVGALLREFLR